VKPKVRILLIDKDNDFLTAQKAALEDQGYAVLTATSGEDGWETLRAEMPDLIVMDVILESHDTGFVLTQRIKNDPLFRGIPILLASSVAAQMGQHFTREKDGFWMKADEYLEKPVESEVLLQKVAGLLSSTES
jgi:CheY-like chemotaxis protein